MPRSSSSESSGSNSSSAKRRHRGRRDRGSRHRSRSRSKTQSSPEGSKRSGRRQRSRSKSREKNDGSSSHSHRKGRLYRRTRSRSRDRSWTKDEIVKRTTNESNAKNSSSVSVLKSSEEQLKQKMQLALQAAANADAQLREQGILTAKPKEWGRYSDEKSQPLVKTANRWPQPTISVKEQMERAKAIDEINATSFHQATFISGTPSSTQAKETEIATENHDSAMFGLGDPNIQPITAKTQVLKSSNVAHENLFADIALREEKWIRKLFLMRQRKLNGEAMN